MGVSTYNCGCIGRRSQHKHEDAQAEFKSKQIDKIIKKDKRAMRKEVKLLLLGAGESGKTTFLKQMRIIHGISFDEKDISEFKVIIYQNIVRGVRVLVDARHKLAIPWGNPHNDQFGCQLIKFENSMSLDTKLFISYLPCLRKLWSDSSIQEAYSRRCEFQLVSIFRIFICNCGIRYL